MTSAINITSETIRPKALSSPTVYPVGSIVTLRMRGHSRTDGIDYYSPAIVLRQHETNHNETIEALVFDSSAGTHFAGAYPIRELGTRGYGGEREMYEVASNVGEVLFSPDDFKHLVALGAHLRATVGGMHRAIEDMHQRIVALEQAQTATVAKPHSGDTPSGVSKK